MVAANAGYIELGRLLIVRGANVNQQSHIGSTPLLLASYEGHTNVVRTLIAHYAKVNAKKYDLVINLHARNFSSKIVKKIKARWKINRSYSIREKYSDILIGSDHELDKSSIERDLDCLRAIGIKPRDKNPEIFITNEEVKWAEDFMLKQKFAPLGVRETNLILSWHFFRTES